MKKEIRLSGTGGQGIIKISVIMAEAALADGYEALQSQAYGPEARGGASKGEVVISDTAVYYPKVETPDMVLCLSQAACDKYAYDIKQGGILVVDSDHCKPDMDRLKGVTVYGVPIISCAYNTVGNALCVNTVALGAFVTLTKAVSEESAMEALKGSFKAKIVPLNVTAFEEGKKLCEKYM